MTVQELIEKLQKMPQDAEVWVGGRRAGEPEYNERDDEVEI